MNKPDFRIYQVGTFVYNTEHGTLDATIPVSQSEQQVLQNLPHPGRDLLDTPDVFSSALGGYGAAQSIDELNDAVGPEYKDLFWALFELAATFRKATRFSLNVSRKEAPTVMIDTPEGRRYAWWHKGDLKIYVTSEVVPTDILPSDEALRTNFNPGELLFAFSIVAEHIRLGSYSFVVGNLLEADRVYVSFFDHEIVDYRVNIDFPLMKEREITTH